MMTPKIKKPSLVAQLREQIVNLQGALNGRDGQLNLFRDKVRSQELKSSDLEDKLRRANSSLAGQTEELTVVRAKYGLLLEMYCSANHITVSDLKPKANYRQPDGLFFDLGKRQV